jgi:hypothetical protein
VRAPKPQISALVGLTILEQIRDQDRPSEVLEDEDLAITLPRRLGLNDVVDSRIRFYQDAARKKMHVREAEIRDLIGLVARRPDSDRIFKGVGWTLAEQIRRRRSYRRLLRKGFLGSRSRNRLGRALARLIGRNVGRFEKGSFTFVSADPLFLDADPGGEACHIVSGFLERTLQEHARREADVVYAREAGLETAQYRWTIKDRTAQADGPQYQQPNESHGE